MTEKLGHTPGEPEPRLQLQWTLNGGEVILIGPSVSLSTHFYAVLAATVHSPSGRECARLRTDSRRYLDWQNFDPAWGSC